MWEKSSVSHQFAFHSTPKVGRNGSMFFFLNLNRSYFVHAFAFTKLITGFFKPSEDGWLGHGVYVPACANLLQDRPCKYNATLRRILATTVTVEKQ
jgi:hypothetical protein